jgi:hypothetical protein
MLRRLLGQAAADFKFIKPVLTDAETDLSSKWTASHATGRNLLNGAQIHRNAVAIGVRKLAGGLLASESERLLRGQKPAVNAI